MSLLNELQAGSGLRLGRSMPELELTPTLKLPI